METYIVTYDIRNPKRLRRVAKTCEDFGCRRQLSIFLCRISATRPGAPKGPTGGHYRPANKIK